MTEPKPRPISGATGKGGGLSPARRALRNTAIVAALNAGRTEKIVAKDYGLTTRQVRLIAAEFDPRSRAYDQQPEEILMGLLSAYEKQIHDFAAVAEDTLERAPAVSIAAMKGGADAVERYVDLLGRVGKLPGDMAYFRTMSEVQHMVVELLDRLALAEAGEMSIGDVAEYARDVVTGARPLYERPAIVGTAAPSASGGSGQGGGNVE